MWVLETSTLELRDFVGASIPPYAILSHTWGDDEVTFKDMRKYREAAKNKAGYTKVQKCCEKAREDGHQYVWIDTCCIDKRSSAELSEAINSMWKWYQKSEVCYAYLADVSIVEFVPPEGENDVLSNSRWFTRGWTLQELIAPLTVKFLGQDWSVIGVKAPLAVLAQLPPLQRERNDMFLSHITKITGIAKKWIRYIHSPRDLREVPIAQKMAWAARRQTAREEDLAYAVMGLFDVNMPILYGEGLNKAFRRLQLEIIQMNCFDHSIFLWRSNRRTSGLLADSPEDFADSLFECDTSRKIQPYSMTNIGLRITLPVFETTAGECVAYPRCWVQVDGKFVRLGIFLTSVEHIKETLLYRRIQCNSFEWDHHRSMDGAKEKDLYIAQDEHAF
ncbi:HET-domain-containing protein [Hyaloscypha hepaticicola]|uniref:HET-domain-containing protein n=1 Tax=Hyaloscypha hepaticicola TaxID=2082293 RepID=A0A2J6QQU4_9HELO|nr:HET-domain-containing protein [Hyaloscypha hepaticicola]